MSGSSVTTCCQCPERPALGMLAVATSDGTMVAGSLDLSVDFGGSSDPTSGSATTMADDGESRRSGSLDVDNGLLDRSAAASETFTRDTASKARSRTSLGQLRCRWRADRWPRVRLTSRAR